MEAMDLLPRFSRLMAEALHCGSTPAGLELPLAEVHERLKLLADEERAQPLPEPDVPAVAAGPELPLSEGLPAPGDAAQRLQLACDNARFAVYAWVDEQILQSSRLDAMDWLGLSLQYHYFDGFKGMLDDSPEALTRYRKAAYLLLRRNDAPASPAAAPARPDGSRVAAVLEKAAYILVPPLVVLLFGALCAAELANIPLPQF